MNTIKIGSIVLVIIIVFLTGCSKKKNERDNHAILSPPKVYLPFSVETRIHHLNQRNRLTYFLQKNGTWNTQRIDGEWVTTGESSNDPAILLSEEKLTGKAKSFSFDFKIFDTQKPFGLIYSNFVLLVRGNNISIYNIDFERDLLQEPPLRTEEIRVASNRVLANEWNSFCINTGYSDNNKLITILYVNGEGVELSENPNDDNFGVFLSPNNKIQIGNFRWIRYE